jgi:hypothetical protein
MQRKLDKPRCFSRWHNAVCQSGEPTNSALTNHGGLGESVSTFAGNFSTDRQDNDSGFSPFSGTKHTCKSAHFQPFYAYRRELHIALKKSRIRRLGEFNHNTRMPTVDDVWDSMKKESSIIGKDKTVKKTSIDTHWLGALSQKAGMCSDGNETKIVETAELKVSFLDAKKVPGKTLRPLALLHSF